MGRTIRTRGGQALDYGLRLVRKSAHRTGKEQVIAVTRSRIHSHEPRQARSKRKIHRAVLIGAGRIRGKI